MPKRTKNQAVPSNPRTARNFYSIIYSAACDTLGAENAASCACPSGLLLCLLLYQQMNNFLNL